MPYDDSAAPPEDPKPQAWGIRERPAPAPQSWEVADAAPEPPAPTPLPPVGGSPPPASPAGTAPVQAPPRDAGASAGFPSTTQLIAAAVAAVLVVGAGGAYLLRSGATPASPTPLSGPAVAVVQRGPAVLVATFLSGGGSGQTLAIPGSPSSMVSSADGSRAFLLDSTRAQVVPVDLARAKVGAPIAAGKYPTDEHLSADGRTLYVVDNLSHALLTIDTTSGTARPAHQLPDGASSFTPSPVGPTGLLSFFTSAGQPGVVAFYSSSSGVGSPLGVGRNTPAEVFYTPDGATVWVTEQGVGNAPGVVIPIDVRTQTPGQPIAVGHGPAGSSMSADGHLLVVSNSIDRSLTIVDLVGRAPVATVAVGAGPVRATLSADGATAWVACALDRTLVPVNLRTRTAGAPVSLSSAPSDISLPKGGGAWVLFASSAGSVSLVDGGSGRDAGSMPVGNEPTLLIAHDSSSAWVANSLSDTVQRLDLSTRRAGDPIHVSRTPNELALTPDHRTLLVLSFGDGTHAGFLTAVDTASSQAGTALSVGVAPSSLTLTPDGTRAFIANHQSNSITTVDLKSWRVGPPIALPCSPSQLVITPDGATVYTNCASSAAVLPVTAATGTVGAPIAVGPNPALLMGNQGKLVFVEANHLLQEILVATNAVVLSHDETGNLVGLSSTPDDATLVAVENTGGALLLLNPATLTTTKSVPVGSRPQGAGLTPDGSRAYVLDTSKEKLYIVDVAAGQVTSTAGASASAAYVVVPSRQP